MIRQDLEEIAADPKLTQLVDEKQVVKVIVIPGKLINFVLKEPDNDQA
jgi:hypothetical protein